MYVWEDHFPYIYTYWNWVRVPEESYTTITPVLNTVIVTDVGKKHTTAFGVGQVGIADMHKMKSQKNTIRTPKLNSNHIMSVHNEIYAPTLYF